MRISDWSSDVCSSDLRSFLAHEPPSHRNRSRIRGPSGEQPRTRHGARPVPLCRIPSGAGDDPKVRRPAPADWITEVTLRVPILTKFGNSAGVHPVKIGSESCRARGFQYGEISVVAVT